jgi:hypothetical protein
LLIIFFIYLSFLLLCFLLLILGGGGFYSSGGDDYLYGYPGGQGFRQGGLGGSNSKYSSSYSDGGYGGGAVANYFGSCNLRGGNGGGYTGGKGVGTQLLDQGNPGSSYNGGLNQKNVFGSERGNGVVVITTVSPDPINSNMNYSSTYTELKDYTGVNGMDLSCGKYISQAASQFACDSNPACLGYSYSPKFGWWCLKLSADSGPCCEAGALFFRKNLVTKVPTFSPTTSSPTPITTFEPTVSGETYNPSQLPSEQPSSTPATESPTVEPSVVPSAYPTFASAPLNFSAFLFAQSVPVNSSSHWLTALPWSAIFALLICGLLLIAAIPKIVHCVTGGEICDHSPEYFRKFAYVGVWPLASLVLLAVWRSSAPTSKPFSSWIIIAPVLFFYVLVLVFYVFAAAGICLYEGKFR